MSASGPTAEELAAIETAACANDPAAVQSAYAAVNARLGLPPSVDAPWAMRLIADGCGVARARLAGARYFAAVPLHADTASAASDQAREVAAA